MTRRWKTFAVRCFVSVRNECNGSRWWHGQSGCRPASPQSWCLQLAQPSLMGSMTDRLTWKSLSTLINLRLVCKQKKWSCRLGEHQYYVHRIYGFLTVRYRFRIFVLLWNNQNAAYWTYVLSYVSTPSINKVLSKNSINPQFNNSVFLVFFFPPTF